MKPIKVVKLNNGLVFKHYSNNPLITIEVEREASKD
jgi:hypothetical protein